MNPAEIAHGWMLLGTAINILLLGVMITQVYLYYVQYKKDKAWIKIFVAALFIADIVNTILCFVYMYRSLITFFGDGEYLSTADWLFATEPATTGIIAMAVQLFFAWRVLVLTKTWYYSAVIGAIAIAGGVASIVTAYEVGRTPHFVDFQNFKQTVIVWLSAMAVGDIIITTILVWHLCRRHKTGFQRSDMIVDKIIRITIQTGMVTMIFASLDLLFYLINPGGLHLFFSFPLCKMYSNSLMSSLNARGGWKFSNNTTTTGESEGQVISTGNFKHAQASSKATDMIRTNPAEVFVHVESHQLRDIAGNKGTLSQSSREEKWAGDAQWSAA